MPVNAPYGGLGLATPFGELLGSSDAEMEAEFADYASLGVKWVRTDFWWSQVQPTQNGKYNWALIDKVVDTAAKYGIEVVGLLNGKPRWVPADLGTAASQKAYADFAAAAAAHFEGRVTQWEIYNEQNLASISPAAYTAMLKGAYTAIKAVDADNIVITGGLSPVPATGGGIWGAVDYLTKMYEAGAKGFFDAVGFHPYTWPLMPDDPAAWNGWKIMGDGIRKAMVAYGDGDLDVWITELGAPTAGGANAISQAAQAEIIKQAVELALTYDWAGPIMWYSYKDRGGSGTDTENWYGLIGPNGEHKEAYEAFKAIATAPDTATFKGLHHAAGAGDDVVVGNDHDNSIWGGTGNDVINGGKGDDVIIGQWGNDTLMGGAGNDRFVFNDHRYFGYDMITDFAAGDVIDLRNVDADSITAGNQAFTFIGTAWLAEPGDLGMYHDFKKGLTTIQGDINGDKVPDFSIFVTAVRMFTAEDFLL